MNKIMPEQVGKSGLDLIRHFEGFQPHVYTCPGGMPTIGFGHVVKEGETFEQPMSVQQAYDLLKEDVKFVEKALQDTVKVPLTIYQFDALSSLIYNIGVGAWEKSNFLKRLNDKEDYYEVSSEFLRWVFAGSKRLRGLMRRRETERQLFIKGVMQ